jgi:beta-lactamase class A
VGIELIETGDTLTVNGNRHFPMQSVYKFPLALAFLHQVDEGKLSLEQKIHISKSELLPNTWSPLRDKYPNGNVDLCLDEILIATVSQSDNNGCDILFRLVGGPKSVNEYIHSLGVKGIAIAATHREWSVQYSNWSTPSAHLQILKIFHGQAILSQQSTDFLRQIMVKTSTGPRRIKGLLPADAIVAHKTGSSGANDKGVSAATNDVGIVTLPDGRHLSMVVFVSDALAEEPILEGVIAEIAKAAWDAFAVKRSVVPQ